MASEAEEKWEGKVSAQVRCSSPDQVWPLLEDFFSLHKWIPSIDMCYGVEGLSGQPGCIRYCSITRSSTDGLEDAVTNWALEKLLATDPVNKSFSYEIVDCNPVGFKSLVATMKLTAMGDVKGEDVGCGMSWSFAVNPIEGWTEKALTEFYGSALRVMAERIEAALSSQGE
ncbi:lachrymatory-factor synthase-like [Rhodamnia argentea]|uniref:Lachrymatory-factor synthase-like n=1 Tax=Rhodamnia argentea TaxID=178133 RepID=A0A8B8N7T8_9MYRT|nr:lachrymatory-factor synthase-like [Rhodamnia argentea]